MAESGNAARPIMAAAALRMRKRSRNRPARTSSFARSCSNRVACNSRCVAACAPRSAVCFRAAASCSRSSNSAFSAAPKSSWDTWGWSDRCMRRQASYSDAATQTSNRPHTTPPSQCSLLAPGTCACRAASSASAARSSAACAFSWAARSSSSCFFWYNGARLRLSRS